MSRLVEPEPELLGQNDIDGRRFQKRRFSRSIDTRNQEILV